MHTHTCMHCRNWVSVCRVFPRRSTSPPTRLWRNCSMFPVVSASRTLPCGLDVSRHNHWQRHCWKSMLKICKKIVHPSRQHMRICRPCTISYSTLTFNDLAHNSLSLSLSLSHIFSYKVRIGDKYTAAQKASLDLTKTLYQVAALYYACK